MTSIDLASRELSVVTNTPEVIEALAGLAQAVSGAVELATALSQVVHVARDVLDADRASLLLLEEPGCLSPAVSAARDEDVVLWTRFRAMPPIKLDLTPDIDAGLRAGQIVIIPDAHRSPLVPREWQLAFDLTSLAVAPLMVDGEPVGALVIDHIAGPGKFSDEQLRSLEGIAALASLAVRTARAHTQLADRSTELDQILAVATALNAAPRLHSVLDTALESFLNVPGARGCALTLVDGHDHLRVLASRGPGQPEPGRYPLDLVPPTIREQWTAAWTADPTDAGWIAPFPYPGMPTGLASFIAAGRLLIIPFTEAGQVRGFAAITLEQTDGANPTVMRRAKALGAQVWLALARARLTEREARRTEQWEALHDIAAVLVTEQVMSRVVEQMAPAIRRVAAVELLDVLLPDSLTARLLRAPVPRGALGRQVKQWSRSPSPQACLVEGRLAVPMILDGQVIGVMVARPTDRESVVSSEDRAALMEIATRLGSLLTRTALRLEVADAQRGLTGAQQRQLAAESLHHAVGRLLASASELLRPCAEGCHDLAQRGQLREAGGLLSQAQLTLHDATREVTCSTGSSGSLAADLRKVAVRHLGGSRDIDVTSTGTARPLPPAVDVALRRAASRALILLRDGRSAIVSIRLAFTDDAVTIDLRGDGRVATFPTHAGATRIDGMAAAQTDLAEIVTAHGGRATVELIAAGVRVHVQIPAPVPAAPTRRPAPRPRPPRKGPGDVA